MKLLKLTLSFILVIIILQGFTQTTIWSEDFPYGNGTTQGSGSPPKWTIDVSNCNFGANGHFEVQTNRMQGRATNGEAIWYSESINILGYTDVVISANLSETGNMEGSDYLRVYYSLDGGAETLFETNGDNTGNFTSLVATQSGLNGSTIDIVIRTNNNANVERHRFDDIIVFEPVAGDFCNSAISIGEVTDLAFSTTSATMSGYSPGCLNGNPVDIWYAYAPSSDGVATFDLCGSLYDTGLGIWDACGGSVLACNDDNGPACFGQNASIELSVSSGSTYYVQVGGWDGGTGNGELTISILAPMVNDDCANAISIGEVSDLPYSTTNATASGQHPGCGGGASPIDLWYAYTPSIDGMATFDLCGSSYDSRIAVWDACGGNILGCNDDDGPACDGLNASFAISVLQGSTYYVQVGGYNNETGNGDLTITVLLSPDNDDCSNATLIGEVTDLIFSTSSASVSGQNPGCGGTPPYDIWFAYNPSDNGLAIFDLCGSSYDTRIAVWDACGGNVLECNDDNGLACNGLNASVEMNVYFGTTYYVQVGGYADEIGEGDLTISLYTIPENDDCEDATAIGEVFDLPFSTIIATASGKDPGCGPGFTPVDIWYDYTPTVSGVGLFDLCGSAFNTRLAIWDDCNSGSSLACNDNNGPVCSGTNASIEMDVVVGTTYYVQVCGRNSQTGDGDLTITVIPYPANDDCANAIAIGEVDNLPYTTLSATASGQNPGCGGIDPIDIWYAYTPSVDGLALFDLCGSTYDSRIAVWDNCGGNVLGCNDDYGPMCYSTNASLTLNVLQGTIYYVQVGGYWNETGNGDLSIIIVPPITNDDCANATPIGEVTDLTFTTDGATVSGQDPGCGGSPPVDIWFAYTASRNGDATFDLCGSGYDTRIAVWDACGGVPLACNDDDGPVCAGLNASLELYVTSGTTYYVQVGGYSTDVGFGDLTIQIDLPGLWTGAVSNYWTDPNNWSTGVVPDENIDVIIPGACPNYPILEDSLVVNASLGAFRCRSIIIEDGGTLEVYKANDLIAYGDITVETGGTLLLGDDLKMKDGGNLYIVGGTVTNNYEYYGDGDIFFDLGSGGYMSAGSLTVYNYFRFYNGSSWVATGGTVHCGGTQDSVLIIIQNSNVYFNNLVVNNGVRAILWSQSWFPLNVNGDLTVETNAHLRIESGEELNVGGDVFLAADATGMATLIDFGTLNIVGTSTAQQYLTSERWHLVSTPISDAEIGVYMDIYLKEYNEPSDTWTYLVNPTTIPMNVAQGYSAWASDGYTGSTTVNYTGTLNTGADYSSGSLSYTVSGPATGWNLMGNPYPAPLQWNNLWTKTDVSEWACLHNNGNDECYNAATGTGWPNTESMDNGIIPSTQGFWVRATSASASLIIPESEREFSTQSFYKGSGEIDNTIRLRVDGNDDFDAILVQFTEDATYDFDARYDLEKRWGYVESPNIYTIHTDDELYSVDVREKIVPDLVIPVGFETGIPGQFHVETTQFDGFTGEFEVILEDIKEGVFITLDKNVTYSFTYSVDDEKHRFNLHFKDSWYGAEDNNFDNINIYSANDYIYIQTPDYQTGYVFIYDLLGQEILAQRISESNLTRIRISNGTAYYIVKFQSDETFVTEKVFIK